jgi:hypothetical protein
MPSWRGQGQLYLFTFLILLEGVASNYYFLLCILVSDDFMFGCEPDSDTLANDDDDDNLA